MRDRDRDRAERGGCGEDGAPVGPGAPRQPKVEAPTLFSDVSGEPTLADLVAGAWEGLVAHQRVPCPLCGETVVPVYGAHAHPSHGRCTGCGTTLS